MPDYLTTGTNRYAGIQLTLSAKVFGSRSICVWVGRFELRLSLDISPRKV